MSHKLLFAGLLLACLHGTGAADSRRFLLEAPAATPSTEFPSPYMTSWSNGKQTKDELATVELIDSSVLPGFGAAQLSARRVTLAPCTTSPLHVHPHGDEIVLVRRGALNFSLYDGDNMSARQMLASDVAVVPFGWMHVFANDRCEPSEHIEWFTTADSSARNVMSDLFMMNDALLQASLGVEDLAAFRQRVNVPGANSSSGGFAILPECAARCAALQAAGQAEPPAQPEPANNYSMSFDSINPPNVNVPTGSISSISARNVPGMPKMKNGGVSLNRVVYKPCTAILAHVHSNADELVFPLQGNLSVATFVNGTLYTRDGLTSDDVVLLPRAYIHGLWNPSCEEIQTWTNLGAQQALVTHVVESMAYLPTAELQGLLGFNGTAAELQATLANAPQEAEGGGFQAFLGSLAECYERCGKGAAPAPAPAGGK